MLLLVLTIVVVVVVIVVVVVVAVVVVVFVFMDLVGIFGVCMWLHERPLNFILNARNNSSCNTKN